VAPAGTGAGDQELVADELAVSVGQDGWSRMLAIIGQMLQRIWAPPVPSG
jgi:hypothetical protein